MKKPQPANGPGKKYDRKEAKEILYLRYGLQLPPDPEQHSPFS